MPTKLTTTPRLEGYKAVLDLIFQSEHLPGLRPGRYWVNGELTPDTAMRELERWVTAFEAGREGRPPGITADRLSDSPWAILMVPRGGKLPRDDDYFAAQQHAQANYQKAHRKKGQPGRPPKKRETQAAIELKGRGLTGGQIAQRTGNSRSAVYKRLQRAGKQRKKH